MSKPDGGPAFPHTLEIRYGNGNQGSSVYGGMSLRDWFAGQALNSIITGGFPVPNIAKAAYEVADAMLAERSKDA